MDTPDIIAIVAVVLLLLVGGVLLYGWQRSRRLRERFGPEYERAVDSHDSRLQAERELAERQRRRERLEIRPLSPEARERYLHDWQAIQTRFVDEPAGAVSDAHGLIDVVLRDRGYPIDDFDRQADDISVDHPEVVEDYRYAYRVWQDAERGEASTEDLREAMVRYRSLFGRLLESPTTTAGREQA